MLNLIRADLFRLARGKTLWVTAGLLSLFSLLTGSGIFAPTIRMTVGNNRVEQSSKLINGSQAPFALMAFPEFLIYAILPVLIAAACADFTHRTIQNTLSRGCSRRQVYVSRLLLVCLIGMILDLLQIALALVAGAAALGINQPLNGVYFEQLAEVFLLQIPLVLGIVSTGVLLVFLFRRDFTAAVVYLLLLTAAFMLTTLWASHPAQYSPLLQFDILYGLRVVATQTLKVQEVFHWIALGAGTLLVSTALGILTFEKSDVR